MKNTCIWLACFFLNLPPLLLAQPVAFVDISLSAGIANTGPNTSVAIADYDNDGYEDIFVGRTGAPVLYHNNGNDSFTEKSAQAGIADNQNCKAAVWGDINNDGFVDIYVTNFSFANKLYLNNGDGTFLEIGVSAGVAHTGKAICVTFMDFDSDGLLDIFLGNRFEPSILYRNKGDLTFEDITLSSGIIEDGPLLGLACGDYDNNGFMDIYLIHDGRSAPNLLYRNIGDGKFEEGAEPAGLNFKGDGMGGDFGDYDNDGLLDLYMTNMGANILYHNNGDGSFSQKSKFAGVDDQGMSWSTFWFDYDNDGFLDLYMVNQSYFFGAVQPNALYRNLGDGTFSDVASEANVASEFNAFGGAYGDFNRDGFLDIFVVNRTQSNSDANELFLNTGGSNNWLKIKLEGTTSNRSAYGARVTVLSGDLLRMADVNAGTGYASQNSSMLHFGLGQNTTVDTLVVRWPGGLVEQFEHLEVNQTIKIIEKQGILTGITETGDSNPNPTNFVLHQNFPNPFNPITMIGYELQNDSWVELKIFNVLGKQITTLVSARKSKGRHTVRWTGVNNFGRQVASGVYFYVLYVKQSAGADANLRQSKKLVLMR